MTEKYFSFPLPVQSELEPTNETSRRFKPTDRNIALYSLVSGYTWTVIGVGLATLLLCVLRRFLNAGDESLLFLPVVIASALRFGFGPACFGAVVSFCCWDYFFDVPYFALTISNAHDFISLLMYLIVAVTVALLASQSKVRAREAESRARETAVLDERNRLARDVHDTLSHTFTGIKFLLEAADRIKSVDESKKCIDHARDLAIEGAQEARRSVLALRPAALEESGSLAEAIRKMAQRLVPDSSIEVHTRVTGVERQLVTIVEDNLLRIAQEAITNALKHSQASNLTVSLVYGTTLLILTVVDDGVGFDQKSSRSGFGLTSMKERAKLAGVSLAINSQPNCGTKVRVEAPLNYVPRT